MTQLGWPLFPGVPGGIELAIIFFFLFIPILVAWGVYYNAQARDIDNAELWGLGIAILFLSSIILGGFGILFGIIDVIIYFFVRTGQTNTEVKSSPAVSEDDQLDTKKSTSITISEKLVDELSDRKKHDESYEDVIWRLIDNQEEEFPSKR